MHKKVLVFHVGDHKTGTTSLQNALAAGLIRIDGAKLHYPAPLNHNYLMGHIRAHLENTAPPKLKPRQLGLSGLADEIRNAGAGYTVVSGEVFENVPAQKFAEIVDTYFRDCADEIRVVAFVRPHAQRLLSSYAEQTKIGWFRGSIEEFFNHNLQNKRFHFAPRFNAWKETFGSEFRLRPMVRAALQGGSVLEDFAHTAFDGRPCQVQQAGLVNESLGLSDLALLRFLQGQFQDKEKWLRHTLGWEFARRLGQLRPVGKDAQEKLALPQALLEQLKLAYLDDAKEVDERFFQGQTWLSDAFDTVPTCQIPQSLEADDHFSLQAQRQMLVLSGIIHDMLDHKGGWAAYLHRHRLEEVAQLRRQHAA